MIRINLLDSGRGAGRHAGRFRAPTRIHAAASLLLLSTALTLAVWAWSMRQTTRSLDRDLTGIDVEIGRLQALLGQLENVDVRRQDLQTQVSAIERLLAGRVDTARVLHELAAAAPHSLWFAEVVHKHPELTVKGHAATLASVSDLVKRLENSGVVRAPVEIVETETASETVAGSRVRFTLKAVSK